MPTAKPIVIAHRGASGYLPEHTLEAKALAHGQGADFLEQDLVLTQDDIPIVLHDIYLENVTNVAERFQGRQRSDGRFYAIDFTLTEIQSLHVSERFHPQSRAAIFPNRFPPHTGRFQIPTLAEELTFIHGLNRSTGQNIGIYPEIKQPAFHRQAGKDISKIVVSKLADFGYDTHSANCFLQCFDEAELKRIRTELGCRLKMILLLETESLLETLPVSAELQMRLQEFSTYADGIGPNLKLVLNDFERNSTVCSRSRLVEAAHSQGLLVHPWTCRADQLPEGFETFTELNYALCEVEVDGCFSDFPDLTIQDFGRYYDKNSLPHTTDPPSPNKNRDSR